MKQAICVNIWNDYDGDESVPAGESQETFAYIEGGDLTDDEKRDVLLQLQQTIEAIKAPPFSSLLCNIKWYDSAAVFPNLVGTEHENCLYKRWQLQMKHLSHRDREQIVEILSQHGLKFNGMSVDVYSES